MLDAGSRSRCEERVWGRMERVRGAGGRAVKTTVEQTLMRGLVTAVPCVRPGLPRSARGRRCRSSATQFTSRVPLRGPAPGPAHSQMSVQVDRTLRGTEVVRLMQPGAVQPHDRWPTGKQPSPAQSRL